MKKLHIIMPMAGEGSRFKNEGINVPKPLLNIDGKYLFERAIESIDKSMIKSIKYSFVVRKNHIVENLIDKIILSKFPSSKIISVDKTTNGSVETCLLAINKADSNTAVLVIDCDLEFKSSPFNDAIIQDLNSFDEKNGGFLLSFYSTDNRYSYAIVDSRNNVEITAEKEVISNNALIGAYYFTSETIFYTTCKEVQKQFYLGNIQKKELYISLLYNTIINCGKRVKLYKSDLFKSYGTPEEYYKHTRK